MKAENQQRHLKILVIEDNPGDARIVELYLTEMDMISGRLQVCETMEAGLAHLAENPDYDAIISDLTLPDTYGMATIEALVNTHPDQTIIIQTGRTDKEIGLQAVKAGAQDFLVKGTYDPETLAKTVKYAIERRSILDRLEETQRQAHIGHFEVNLKNDLVTGSSEYCRMLRLDDKQNTFVLSELLAAKGHLGSAFSMLETQKPNISASTDVCVKFAEGDIKWFVINGKLNSDGEVYTGLLQDITTRKETEEMQRQHEVGQQAAAMKEQFIASVSHEMRTPMNAILGMSNLLLNEELQVEQRNYINSIRQSSELLLGIVNDILTISTLQNGVIQYQQQAFHVEELLANILNIVSYKVYEKELLFDLQIDENIATYLIGDKLRLNQILLNLIGNALKFTDKGSVTVKVQLAEKTESGMAVNFTVIDTGIGIPSDKIDAIFESFTRVKYKDRIFEGTGLGLSIARKLIEQQGGWVKVCSEIGVGSTFMFQMPFKIAQSETDIVHQGDVKQLIDTSIAFRVLLAEDNKLNQIVAIKTIEREFPNAIIDLATNGEEAIKLFAEHIYHVVLMDLQMPIMDGTEAVKWIREHAPWPRNASFVLAMTAHAHMGDMEQVRAIYMDDYVLKPFEPEQLFAKINQYATLALQGEKSTFGNLLIKNV
jgi:signal transduction histidine kinase